MIENYGGASRDRTDDLIVANDALSQLSYSPLWKGSAELALTILSTILNQPKSPLYFSRTSPETQRNYLDELDLAASN